MCTAKLSMIGLSCASTASYSFSKVSNSESAPVSTPQRTFWNLSTPLCSAISSALSALMPLFGVPTLRPTSTYSPQPNGTYCSASSRETP